MDRNLSHATVISVAALVAALAGGVLSYAKAATIRWDLDPSSAGDWNYRFNWDPDQVPAAWDTAIIDNDGTAEIHVGDGGEAKVLYIGYQGDAQSQGNGYVVTWGALNVYEDLNVAALGE